MKKILTNLSLAALTFITPVTSFADFIKNSEIMGEFVQTKTNEIKYLTYKKEFEKLEKELKEIKEALNLYKNILFEFNLKSYEIIKKSNGLEMGVRLGSFALAIKNLKKQLDSLKRKKEFKRYSLKKVLIMDINSIENEIKFIEKSIQYYIDITGDMINAKNFFQTLNIILTFKDFLIEKDKNNMKDIPIFNELVKSKLMDKQYSSMLSKLGIKDFWFSIEPGEKHKTLFISIEHPEILEQIDFEKFLKLEEALNDVLYKIKDSKKAFFKKQQLIFEQYNSTPYDFSRTYENHFEKVSLI